MQPSATPEPVVPSPCVGICKLDGASRYCIGCLRTLQEIGEWSVASNERKRAILDRIARERAIAWPAP